MARNRYKVPKSQWKKWGMYGQDMFNRTYSHMKVGKSVYCATEIAEIYIPNKRWSIIAWNAAFMATCNMLDIFPELRGLKK